MNRTKIAKPGSQGFTLVELLVGILLTAVASGILFSSFFSQNNTYLAQEQVVEMQQNLRGALELVTREMRLCGLDPDRTRGFGITDVMVGSGGMACTADWEGNNDPTDPANEISYEIDGGKLYRTKNDEQKLLAEGIEGLAFAYAYDSNEDGNVEISTNGHVLWAIDSDGDGDLDKYLDTNDDGVIDANDTAGGAALGTDIALDRIRAVRVWLLAKSRIEDKTLGVNRTYAVGGQRIVAQDRFRRRMLVSSFNCRNLGV